MERRRRARWVIGGLAVLWLAGCLALVTTAVASARDGRARLEDARRELALGDLLDGSLVADLDGAARSLGRAAARLAHPALTPWRPAPVVGRHLATARAMVRAARDAASVLADAGERARRLVDDAAPTPEGRLAVVGGLHDLVGEIEQEVASLDLGPDDALVGSLADLRAELAVELDELRQAAADGRAATGTLLALLGGPQRTLVLAANNAEMRAGAGMFLAAGVIESTDGEAVVGELLAVEDLGVPAGAVVLPPELDALWGWAEPDVEPRNLMLSPRFPVAAELAAAMWAASGRGPVDGVLAIDPVALGAMLEVTGPVEVGDRSLDADGVVDELLHEQYLRFDRSERPERQEQAGAVASAVLRAVVDGDWDVVAMVEALQRSAAGRHLLGWSPDPDLQAGWVAAGVDGDIPADGLLLALSSRASGKVDPFIRVSASISSSSTAEGVDVVVQLRIENRTPAGEPPTVTRDRPEIDLVAGRYRAILTASVPGAASAVGFDGVDALNVAGPDGASRVVGYQLDLDRGQLHEATLRFRLPPGWRELDVLASARVPTIRWSDDAGEWRDHRSRRRELG